MNYIPLFYYLSNNFGDCLSHYIAKKISGKEPVLLSAQDEHIKYMITGSILNNEVLNAICWGCGLANSNDIIPSNKIILAVRGRLTGEKCDTQNVSYKNVYGDPALLLPRLYSPKSEKKYKIGIIPHYVDAKIVLNSVFNTQDIKIINVLDDIETIIEQINQCEKCISSSLHGIIVSHAYGIPCEWVKFSDFILGDDFKYYDYFSTTSKKEQKYYDFRGGFDINTIKNLFNEKFETVSIKEDLDLLFNNCPFK